MDEIQNTVEALKPVTITSPEPVITHQIPVSMTQKKPPLLWIAMAIFVAVTVGAFVLRDKLFPMATDNITVTPTPTLRTLTIVTAATPLTVELGKEFTFQVRVTETLTTPTFRIEQLEGASVSTTGLVTWKPTKEGSFAGKVLVTDTDAKGELLLAITVTKATPVVVNQFVIPETLAMPEFPVFYTLNVKDIQQLWVMNKDGSGQKFTGVQYIIGQFENVQNYGGVLYAVDKSRGKEILNAYYYSAITKKTVTITHEGVAKGFKAQVSNPSFSPSLEYISYTLETYEDSGSTMGSDISYYTHSLALNQTKAISENPSTTFEWSTVPNSIKIANEKGTFALHVWTGEKVLLTSNTTKIPSEGNFLEVSKGVTLELLGDSDADIRLVLTKDGTSTVVETSPWADLQSFYCVSPDKKRVLFERRSSDEGGYSYAAIRSLDIATGITSAITPPRVVKEQYAASGCIWTSNHTILIEKHIDRYGDGKDVYIMELDITTNVLKQITTTGIAALLR